VHIAANETAGVATLVQALHTALTTN